MEGYADPWRDTDVIDKRAVRFSQGVVAVMALLGIIFSPLFWLLMAGQLLIGLFLGRRWCLPCLFYYLVLQPRFGQGELEDSRPPRFANIIGATLLLSAYILSFWIWATPLAGLVFLLASLAALTGFCLGCTLYRFLAHLRGVRSFSGTAVDLDDFPKAEGTLLFSHPLCLDCQLWKERVLGAHVIDVSKNHALAKKYGILVVPTVYEIDDEGVITKQLAP